VSLDSQLLSLLACPDTHHAPLKYDDAAQNLDLHRMRDGSSRSGTAFPVLLLDEATPPVPNAGRGGLMASPPEGLGPGYVDPVRSTSGLLDDVGCVGSAPIRGPDAAGHGLGWGAGAGDGVPRGRDKPQLDRRRRAATGRRRRRAGPPPPGRVSCLATVAGLRCSGPGHRAPQRSAWPGWGQRRRRGHRGGARSGSQARRALGAAEAAARRGARLVAGSDRRTPMLQSVAEGGRGRRSSRCPRPRSGPAPAFGRSRWPVACWSPAPSDWSRSMRRTFAETAARFGTRTAERLSAPTAESFCGTRPNRWRSI